jgi:hypothetical protein
MEDIKTTPLVSKLVIPPSFIIGALAAIAFALFIWVCIILSVRGLLPVILTLIGH